MQIVFTFVISFLLTALLFLHINKGRNVFIVRCLLLGYVLRVGLMFVDLYTDIPILGSGSDSEDFHRNAMQYMAQGYNGLDEYNYAYLLGIIYSITNGSRIFAQYLNVLMGMGVLIIMLNIMKMLSVPLERQKKVILIAAIMPNLVIFSAILLREAWIEFFLILSLYWFVIWFLKKGDLRPISFSVLCVLLSSWMHAGCIFVAVGYFAAFITYNRSLQSFKLSRSSIASLILLSIFSLFFISYMDVFGGKFAGLAEMDSDQISGMIDESPDGGSIYLSWLPLTFSILDVAFLPIRMFYFLFSPIPFDWRGVNDLIAFLIDSSIYIWLFLRIYKDVPRSEGNRLLGRYLLLTVLLSVAVFSVGTVAAGTAMRHRAKIASIIFILYTLYDLKEKNEKKYIETK